MYADEREYGGFPSETGTENPSGGDSVRRQKGVAVYGKQNRREASADRGGQTAGGIPYDTQRGSEADEKEKISL